MSEISLFNNESIISEIDISMLEKKLSMRLNKVEAKLKYKKNIIKSRLSNIRKSIKQREYSKLKSYLSSFVDKLFFLVIIYLISIELIVFTYDKEGICLINSLFRNIIVEY